MIREKTRLIIILKLNISLKTLLCAIDVIYFYHSRKANNRWTKDVPFKNVNFTCYFVAGNSDPSLRFHVKFLILFTTRFTNVEWYKCRGIVSFSIILILWIIRYVLLFDRCLCRNFLRQIYIHICMLNIIECLIHLRKYT